MKKLFWLPLCALITSCVPHMTQKSCLGNWYSEGVSDGAVGRKKRDIKQIEAHCKRYDVSIDIQSYEAGWKQGLKQYCIPNYNIGFADGFAGKAEENIKNRAQFCAETGITLNLIDYHSGYRAGLKSFCSHENGMLVAKQGKPLPTICPEEWRTGFEAGWAVGRDYLCVKHTDMAYELGSTGQPYPEICSAPAYQAFRKAYGQGQHNAEEAFDIEEQISEIKKEIASLSENYAFSKEGGRYKLTSNVSNEAQSAMSKVNALLKKQKALELRLSQLNVAKL